MWVWQGRAHHHCAHKRLRAELRPRGQNRARRGMRHRAAAVRTLIGHGKLSQPVRERKGRAEGASGEGREAEPAGLDQRPVVAVPLCVELAWQVVGEGEI